MEIVREESERKKKNFFFKLHIIQHQNNSLYLTCAHELALRWSEVQL